MPEYRAVPASALPRGGCMILGQGAMIWNTRWPYHESTLFVMCMKWAHNQASNLGRNSLLCLSEFSVRYKEEE